MNLLEANRKYLLNLFIASSKVRSKNNKGLQMNESLCGKEVGPSGHDPGTPHDDL